VELIFDRGPNTYTTPLWPMPVGHVVDGRYVVYEDCECNLGDTDMCYSGF